MGKVVGKETKLNYRPIETKNRNEKKNEEQDDEIKN